MAGHFREPHKFDLADLGVLAGGPDKEFDFAVGLAARAVRAPVATFATADFVDRLSRIRAHTGLGAGGPRVTEVPLEISLAFKAAAGQDRIAVSDTLMDPRTAAHPFLRSHGLRSLLAAPVHFPADEVVALLCVHDTLPRIWNAEESDALAQAAHFCTQVILLRAALKTLSLISRESEASGLAP